ncbi:hypothetical protein NHX12_025621, partial [Muraenolepis orangiensis]
GETRCLQPCVARPAPIVTLSGDKHCTLHTVPAAAAASESDPVGVCTEACPSPVEPYHATMVTVMV